MSEEVSQQRTTERIGISNFVEPFVFIPLTPGEVAVGRGPSKHIVQAQVTRIRHARANTRYAMQHMQPWTVKAYAPQTRVPALSKSENSRKTPAASRQKDDEGEAKPTTAATAAKAQQHPSSTYTFLAPNSHVAYEKGNLELVPKFLGGTQQEDPFWTYPVDYESSLSPIFAHYIENIAVDIPDLDGTDQKSLLRRRWFPLAMTEPATMYAVLLMAAAHYCVVSPSGARKPDLLRLKVRALAEISTALNQASLAVSDAIIGAVMKMAAYEAIFGEPSVYAAHMRGLIVMLRMRGGMSKLGLDGLLERMLVWIDLNAAHLTGSSRIMGGEDMPTAVKFSGPDPFHFSGIS